MRAFQIQGGFGLENLREVDLPEPTPRRGEVVVEMAAASLNYRDLLMVKGHYNPRQPLPLVPFSDGVGRIVALGEGVQDLQEGDRVCPIFAQGWLGGEADKDKLRTTLGGPLDGVLRDRAAFPAESVVRVPEHLTDAEAACLPCAGVTAWSALVEHGQVKAGDTVLLQGTGGVSIFALQLARLSGARVIITSSSDEKLARAKGLGADVGLNYKREPAWGKLARKRTGGRGVDLVIEVGGAQTLQQSLQAVRVGGRIAVIGVLSGASEALNITPVLMGQVRLQGILVGHKDGFEAMNRAIAAAEMRPVVDRIFPIGEVREALAHMASGAHFGKICLAF